MQATPEPAANDVEHAPDEYEPPSDGARAVAPEAQDEADGADAGALPLDEHGGAWRRAEPPIVWLVVGIAAALALVWLYGRVASRRASDAAPVQVAVADDAHGERRATASVADRVDAALLRPDVSDELKIAFVDEIARDGSDTATDMLLRTTSNPSVLVSMAAIKGLSGRPCARTEGALGVLLREDDWRRRAWAAKVLGASGCASAVDALSDRWASESDARVRDQIAEALRVLRTTGTE